MEALGAVVMVTFGIFLTLGAIGVGFTIGIGVGLTLISIGISGFGAGIVSGDGVVDTLISSFSPNLLLLESKILGEKSRLVP